MTGRSRKIIQPSTGATPYYTAESAPAPPSEPTFRNPRRCACIAPRIYDNPKQVSEVCSRCGLDWRWRG